MKFPRTKWLAVLIGLFLTLSLISRQRALPGAEKEAIAVSQSGIQTPIGFQPARGHDDTAAGKARTVLGKRLFFDPRLSSDGRVSCGTCHRPERFYADDEALSTGVHGESGMRNAPSLLNVAYQERLLWDGLFPTLEDQVGYPMLHPREMGTTKRHVVETVSGDASYAPLFQEAFGKPDIDFKKISRAIAAYERTLVSGNSPFDRFYFGSQEQAISESAKRGWELFSGKAKCISCHTFTEKSPFFTDFAYHNTGVGWELERPDLGRYRVTHHKPDRGKFKTPSLRNVAETAPYMHDGRFSSLPEVIEYYAEGAFANPYLDDRIRPLGLSPGQKEDLLAFLRSLTGERPFPPGQKPPFEVVAGSREVWDGRLATQVTLAGVSGLAVDTEGNLYVSDIGRNRVRRVDSASGIIKTVLGNGHLTLSQGPAAGSEFPTLSPGALALDAANENLYVAEVAGKRVLKLHLQSGQATSLPSPRWGFGQPVGLLWTASGLLVVDTLGQIWRQSEEGWIGLLSRARALRGGIRSLARRGNGDLILSEFFSHRLVKWDASSGSLETVAGSPGQPGRSADGLNAVESVIRQPDGLVLDSNGNILFADMGNARICSIGKDGRLKTLYAAPPKDDPASWVPGSLALDRQGDLWVGDVLHNRVLRFADGDPQPQVIAGGGPIGDGGPAREAQLAHPGRVCLDEEGNLYISEALHHRVRRVSPQGIIETVAGTGAPGFNGDGKPGTEAQLNFPAGLLVGPNNRLYIADYYNNRVRSLDLTSGFMTTLAGNGRGDDSGDLGPARDASLLNPHALALDGRGRLLITSAVAQSVKAVDLDTRFIDSVKLDAQLVPAHRVLVFYGIAAAEDRFYLADGMRNLILAQDSSGMRRWGDRSDLNYPMDVALSPEGEVYVCDTRNNRILRLTDRGQDVVLEALGRPRGVSFDREGNLYVADTFHNRVLKVRRAHLMTSR